MHIPSLHPDNIMSQKPPRHLDMSLSAPTGRVHPSQDLLILLSSVHPVSNILTFTAQVSGTSYPPSQCPGLFPHVVHVAARVAFTECHQLICTTLLLSLRQWLPTRPRRKPNLRALRNNSLHNFSVSPHSELQGDRSYFRSWDTQSSSCLQTFVPALPTC